MIRSISKYALACAAFAPLAACNSASDQTASQAGQSVQKTFDDGAIYAQIEAKFAGIDPDSTLHVAVAVHDGSVDLSGRARSLATLDKFERAAKSIDGVKRVSARITVAPGIPNTADQAKDVALAAEVTANLAGQGGLNAAFVNVSADRGVVTLKGKAKTQAIESTLVAAAKSTAGVKGVVNQLSVGGT